MDTQKLCQNCRVPLAANAPRGLCPACLMKVAMATGTVAGQEKPGFTPPSTEELARKFPQLDIIELIGRGGMGAVYKARQKELDRIVALKILPPGIGDDPAFAERFAREAKALARLNHPGIVTIYDSGRTDGLFYFLMEFVDGVSLGRLMHGGRVSPREALAIVPQICDALQYAHDQGIVHRDIKPENILLDRLGRVKVADFGLAKLVAGTQQPLTPSLSPSGGERVASKPGERRTSALTDAGKVMGTPAYMAPEQAEHPSAVDHRADIYALGVVFYQMLTGELPGKSLEPPSKKVQIDVRLDEVVLHALEKDPERRYQQVSEIKTGVETIAATPHAFDESASQSQSLPKVCRCSVSTPEHLRTFQGRLLYNFQAKGELRLDRETLSFDSGWSVVGIPLSSIRALGLGNYPVSVFKRMPVNYMEVTFSEHGVSRTLLFTPTVGVNSFRTWLTSRLESDKAVETSKLVMQWFFALREAVRASTGRMLPVSHSEAKTPSRLDSAKAYLLAAAAFAIPFAMLLLIFEGGLPNPFSELLPDPITNAFAAFKSLPSIARVAVWIVIYIVAWRLFMALVQRGARRHIIAIANSIPLPAEDNSWLALVDSGDYARSWEAAAASFQSTISKEEWVARLEKVRRPLGKVISRQLRSLKFPRLFRTFKDAAVGTRLEERFNTSFDGLVVATETVTYAQQPNGEWQAIGYLIRPAGTNSRLWFGLGAAMVGGLVLLGVTHSASQHQKEQAALTALGTLQTELGHKIATLLAEQWITYSQIQFYFSTETPAASVNLVGLRGWRGVTNGVPRHLCGQLMLHFEVPGLCDLAGDGDLGAIRASFPIVAPLPFKWAGRQNAASDKVNPQSPESLSFGPVIERVVTAIDDNPAQACLDLGSGEYHSPPPAIADEIRLLANRQAGEYFTDISSPGDGRYEWLKTSGVDLIGGVGPDGGPRFKYIGQPPHYYHYGDQWGKVFESVSPADVMRELQSSQFFAGDKSNYPSVYINAMNPKDKTTWNASCILFRTHDGDVGVMQIHGATDHPRGVKIRYKLVQKPALPRSLTPEQQPSFGPVIERELLPSDEDKTLLNLATGNHVGIPKDIHWEADPVRHSEAFGNWLEQVMQVDVMAATERDFPRLGCLGLCHVALQGVMDEAWDQPGRLDDDALSVLRTWSADPDRLSVISPGKLPATFAFRTRTQAAGLLQIVGFTDDLITTAHPRGVKIRYKLVQSPEKKAVAPTTAGGFGPVVERLIQSRQTGTNAFLDLETGRLLTPPPDVTNALVPVETDGGVEQFWKGLDIMPNTRPFKYIEWLRESGADLMFNNEEQIIAFEGVFAVAYGEGAINWDDWTGLSPETTRTAVETIERATRGTKGGYTIAPASNSGSRTFTSAKRLYSRYPSSPAVDLLTREQSAMWFFKTREGSIGLLQILGFTDNPRGVKIRYKLVRDSQGSAALKPIPPKAMELAAAWRAYAEAYVATHDMKDTNVNRAFGKESNVRLREIGELLRDTIAEPLWNQQHEQIAALQKASQIKDMEKVRAASDQLKATGTQLDKMLGLEGRAYNHKSAPPAGFQFRWVAAEGDTDSPADLLLWTRDRSGEQKLRVLREVVLDGDDVASAGFTTDQPGEKVLVVFLTDQGVRKFAEATAKNVGRQLAIVWHGWVISAPVIASAITGRRVNINGLFSDAQAQQLLDVLNHRPPGVSSLPP